MQWYSHIDVGRVYAVDSESIIAGPRLNLHELSGDWSKVHPEATCKEIAAMLHGD